MEEDRSPFKILTGREPLGRWGYNIRIDLKEIGVNTKNWIVSAQIDLMNAALNLQIS